MAQKYGRTVLRTQEQTSAFMSSLIGSLYNHLAPRITRSGVMMEIYGEGVLFQGESGVGKSEVAIELIKRGHRTSRTTRWRSRRPTMAPWCFRPGADPPLHGAAGHRGHRCTPPVRHGGHQDESGDRYGHQAGAWDDTAVYDRLGLENTYTEILGVQLPALTIPVKPGRNLASIVEVAAMNNRNRKMGHNAALELTRRMDQHFCPEDGCGDE